MTKQVKIIIERLNKNEIKKINNYIANFKQIVSEEIAVTILDPRHNADYNNLIEYYEYLNTKLPKVTIINFYLSFYFLSDVKGNVNKFTKQYIGNREFKRITSSNIQEYFLPSSQEIIRPIVNKDGNLSTLEILKKGDKPHKKISVNRAGNIQVVRSFDKQTHVLLTDEYLDTQLNPRLKICFNNQGLRESYQLLGADKPLVFSEIDLFDQWFDQVVEYDDYVINMNHEFNIIFSNKHDGKKLFLM